MTGPIVLVTGAAPYLGGASTWKPLREAATDVRFRELDLFDLAIEPDPLVAARHAIEAAIADAGALVAHGSVASVALDAVANVRPQLPVLLLSPMVIAEDSARLRLVRFLAGGPAGRILNRVAASKTQKLRTDRAYLRAQLEMLVHPDAVSGALLEEARERVADPRMESMARHTAQTLLALLKPNPAFQAFRGSALYGESALDRKNCTRLPGTVLPGAYSAPMLEAPREVARHLHAMMAGKEPVSPA